MNLFIMKIYFHLKSDLFRKFYKKIWSHKISCIEVMVSYKTFIE